MEEPFGPQQAAHTQHHLPKQKRSPDPSKAIALGKPLTAFPAFPASVALTLANITVLVTADVST